MAKPLFLVPEQHLPSIKAAFQQLRQYLIDADIKVPGKRGFLDVIARSMGFSSFSHLTIEGQGQAYDEALMERFGEHAMTIGSLLSAEIEELDQDRACDFLKRATGNSEQLRHHLSIQESHCYYYSTQRGFFYSAIPIDTNTVTGVESLARLSIVAEGLPGCYSTFSRWSEAIDIAESINDSWDADHFSLVYGPPDTYVVDERLKSVLTPLVTQCAKQGIDFEFVSDANRTHQNERLKCFDQDDHGLATAIGCHDLEDASDNITDAITEYQNGDHSEWNEMQWRQRWLYFDSRWDEFEENEQQVLEPVAIPLSAVDPVYASKKLPKGAINGPLFFQSKSCGGEVVDATQMQRFVDKRRDTESWLLGHEFETLVDTATRCSRVNLDDLENQKEELLKAGVLCEPKWIADAYFCGLLRRFRDDLDLKPYGLAYFNPDNIKDASNLISWAVTPGSEGILVPLGDDVLDGTLMWLALIPAGKICDTTLLLAMDRDLVAQWEDQGIEVESVSWGTVPAVDSVDLHRLSFTRLSIEDDKAFAPVWSEYGERNADIMDLFISVGEHYFFDNIEHAEGLREQLLVRITNQTRILGDWLPWRFKSNVLRDLVCRLWDFDNWSDFLRAIDAPTDVETRRLENIAENTAEEGFRKEMENILLNLSDEKQRENPMFNKLRRVTATKIVEALFDQTEPSMTLIETEMGDWICEQPIKWVSEKRNLMISLDPTRPTFWNDVMQWLNENLTISKV